MVKVDGFKQMKADVGRREVTVTYDPKKTKPEKLAQAINTHTEFRASVPSAPG